MTLEEVFEEVKKQNIHAKKKHGAWAELEHLKQHNAIMNEVEEWLDAYNVDDVYGEHGEIAELIQVMNVCARRIMSLTGEHDA